MFKYLFLLTTTWYLITAQDQPSCDSLVYCQGNLLHTVQMAQIFNDSKTFVDMELKNSVETTLKNFNDLMSSTNNNPTKQQITDFVNQYFQSPNDLVDWVPADYKPEPSFISEIDNEEVKQFAKDLVAVWPTLGRKINPLVKEDPERYSLIYVDNGFIIPGGRFKEFYYWDSFWIVQGLLVCEMTDTVRGMLDNFLSLVDRFGFIPNGARIYYLNRSQPPLLSYMAASYFEATNDTEWLRKNIRLLDKELSFFLDHRTIEVEKNGTKYTLAHYDSESSSPRPESYREDVNSANYYTNETEKKQLYADLKSGAESGWDFSSRWIIDQNGGNEGNISLIKTRQIIPVDLNAFLCRAFRLLSEFYVILGDVDSAVPWYEKSIAWEKTIEKLLYNEEDGIWYDYDIKNQKPRKYFYPSNFAPLWTQCYHPLLADEIGQRAADYFKREEITNFLGGIPTSLDHTGEQWDYPNAWPPLQSIAIFGLEKTGNLEAQEIAADFANIWIRANMIGYNETKQMFEKYDAEKPGQNGGGGEYPAQAGFGWTNGIAFEMIKYFHTKNGKRWRS